MNPLKYFFAIVGVAVLVLAIIFSYADKRNGASEQGIRVAVSFYPLAHIVAEVGGANVTVENILPPGGEPHDYEPSPQQLAGIGKSDLFIFNGAHFEPWVERWQAGSFTKPPYVLDMVEELGKRGVPLRTVNGEIDPHVWLDPVLYLQEIEIVRGMLSEIDPDNAPAYYANAQTIIAEGEELERHFREGLAVCEKHDIIVSHEAFAYLAERYGFNAISIAGISPDEEPSPKTLAELTKTARAKGISYIFFETSVSPRLSEAIAREVGAQTLVLNPLESLTTSEIQSGEHYHTIMEKNLVNLRKSLLCH